MWTYITWFGDSGRGIGVAIKDLIDVAGVPTTAACRALAEIAKPAARDAPCLREIRRREAAGEVWLVGKTNLHELAYGTTGVNPWWGTPVNPRYPHLLPGGSSSGSAAAVAAGEAVVGIGTDTGGSVRIPAACCGIAGLKTTWGRLPTSGVWPLAPSLDTVGPLAADVAGLLLAMPVLAGLPPGVDGGPARLSRLTVPVNLAGLPALSLPVGEIDGARVSMQLIAPGYGEEMLLGLGVVLEAAVAGASG